MSVSHMLFGFSGRMGRFHFWMSHLAVIGIAFLIGFVVGLVGSASASSHAQMNPAAVLGTIGIGMLALLVLFILPMWIFFAATIKRLHDRNKSGYWVLLTFVPLAIIIFTGVSQGVNGIIELSRSLIFSLFGLSISAWYWIELGFFSGVDGGNSYGGKPGAGNFLSGLEDFFDDDDYQTASASTPTGSVAAYAAVPVSPRPATGPVSRKPQGFGKRRSV